MVMRRGGGADDRQARIAASPQFNGRTFVNANPVSAGFKPGVERPSLADFLCGGQDRVPSGPLPLVDPRAAWRAAPDTGLRLTRIGHSTLLIELDGVRILTDPVWGERASPLAIAGPRRFHPPPVALDALPPLDFIIISHDHYDHLDRGTIRALARGSVPFVTSLGVGAHLEKWGVPAGRITELDWWESLEIRGVQVTAAPAQHFSGRSLRDRNATLWSSFHLQGPGHSFFFGADSGLMPEFADIGRRLGPFDVAALEVGAYHPSWGDIHLGPVNALTAHRLLGSGALLPIHWGTFNLALHPWAEPAETLLALVPDTGVRLLMPKMGEPIEPSRVPLSVEPWWRMVAGARAPAASPDALVDDGPLEWLPD